MDLVDGGAPAVEPDFFYLAAARGFIVRVGGRWQLNHPLDSERVLSVLNQEHAGYTGPEDTDPRQLALAALRGKAYPIVFRSECVPVTTDPEKRFRLDAHGHPWFNTWTPPMLVPAPGAHPRIVRLLTYLTATTERGDVPGMLRWVPDIEGYRWLEHWLAAKVKNPQRRPGVAVILTTNPGAGKGTLNVIMREILGPANCAELTRNGLDSSFTASWVDKFWVFADEITSGAESRNTSELLKTYIASPELACEQKYQPRRMVANRLAWVFASNDNCPVPIEERDRRYTVYDNRVVDPVWQREIRSCFGLKDNAPTPEFLAEIAGFAAHLLALDVDYDFVSRPYESQARQALKDVAKGSVEAFLDHLQAVGADAVLEHHRDVTAHRSDAWWQRPGTWLEADGIHKQVLYECYKTYHDAFCPGQKVVSYQRFCGAMKRAGYTDFKSSHGDRPMMWWVKHTSTDRFKRGAAATGGKLRAVDG